MQLVPETSSLLFQIKTESFNVAIPVLFFNNKFTFVLTVFPQLAAIYDDLRVNEGRRQEAGGRFCHEDLYPVTKTFCLKRQGFKPDCFDNK